MPESAEFPELKTSLSDRESRDLKRRKSAPFHSGMILICILIILASALGVFQSALLLLSPHIVETQRRQIISSPNYRTHSSGYGSRQKKTQEPPNKAATLQLFEKIKQMAKFDFAIGLFKLPVSLVLIVSTFFCFFRARWARGLTRWFCLLAAILTVLQYGAFGIGIWTSMKSRLVVSQQILLANMVAAVVVGVSMVAIYFSSWNVLNFPAIREIFRD